MHSLIISIQLGWVAGARVELEALAFLGADFLVEDIANVSRETESSEKCEE